MKAYDVKKKMMVAQYQWGFFRSELKKQKAKYEHWKSNQQNRAEKEGLKYFSYEELYEDYIIGAIDQNTYIRQKKLYNNIIADNWQRADKIEWLEQNCEKYRIEYEALKELYESELARQHRKHDIKYLNKKNGYRKRTYDMTKNRSKYNQPKIKKKGDDE